MRASRRASAPPKSGLGSRPNRIKDSIHVLAISLERCFRVINGTGGAELAQVVQIGGGGSRYHLGAAPSGKLDRRAADATSAALNENRFSQLKVDASIAEQGLPGRGRNHRATLEQISS